MRISTQSNPVLVVGGGIGGLAAALALAREGCHVKVLEQASVIGEIGAGVQFGPNAFAAFDALGVGERTRAHAVYTDHMMMVDAVDGGTIADIPVGAAFRKRFGNPYAVTHRADVHSTLLEGVRETDRIEFVTATRIVEVSQSDSGVTAFDEHGNTYRGCALVAADGVKSAIRQQLVGDPPRVSGHVVYRAVIDAAQFPRDMQWNAPVLWVGPNCHVVHYPVRAGEQYNLVVTFHSRQQETWGVSDGSQEEVLSYFQGIDARPFGLLSLPPTWRRWATADREPIGQWTHGAITMLGDAAHPLLQYLAQGACMAVEDAVTLGAAVRACDGDLLRAFSLYQDARITRTARVVLSTREFGRLCHASGVERLVRNALWKGRSPERFYDALEWLYGWKAETCLSA
ncbi:salicylate hydroxylase [Cupriavidus sp. TA19]|uniref:3-hydroxybenzoate 6-monooxygenase n=1 Tax=unclassified Cupriavidus TaxID=2640874 RepID=UPI000E2EA6AA|nr:MULTISPECIES: 3-hydroxybenzoate 6-monooxygenase [unclassified Cupriavidus]BDB27526.1 3-hydroxybenzoate 6-monooxygenase [Cupriavidus sp. P-10]GLC97283.1 salicylate hydroxylase [Cupriavidus sp. TA19]